MVNKQKNSEDVTRISFRILNDETARELDKRAKSAGQSRHDFARDLVMAGMTAIAEERHEIRRLRTELANLGAEIKSLRELQQELLQVPETPIPEELVGELHQIAVDIERLKRVPRLLQTLRHDHATGVSLLAANAGKLTPEEARQWVLNTLLANKKG